ncbi:MAG: RNA polymerase sigma factor, partial [Steroidobacteraceae bacterium]
LAAYQTSRSADLFAQIHTRHGAMIYRTARRLTTNRQDAEDVVQTVFALLAQRPELVQRNLGGWLHEVTRNTALNLQRSHVRQVRREQTVARMKSTGAVPNDNDLRDELDVALAQLEPALREAVVLRYLEGHSQEESARLAGCPRGTLSRRAAEGLKHLRKLLARRGVVVPSALLLGFLGREAAGALPAAFAAGSTSMTAVSAKVAAKTLFWVKAIACATAVTAATATTLTVASLRQPPPPSAPPPPIVRAPVATPFAPAGGLDMGLPRDWKTVFSSRMPKTAGSHSLKDGTLTVKSSGLDVFRTHDSCYFVYQTLAGDGEISARIVSVENTGVVPKAGVMIRQALEPASANVLLAFHWKGGE